MKKMLIAQSYSRLISLSLILGLLAFNPGIASGAPDDKGMLLSATNEQITLLYIDALNLYTEGKYINAIVTLERIKERLKSEPYVYNVRKELQIQPTDKVLDEFIAKLKQKDIDYQNAKQALDKGNYPYAKEIFTALAKDSPQCPDIPKYLRLIDAKEAKERSRQEQLKAVNAEKQKKEGLRQAELDALARQKQALVIQKEKETQEREAARLQKLKEQEQAKLDKARKLAQEKEERQKQLEQEQKAKDEEALARKQRKDEELARKNEERQKQLEQEQKAKDEEALARRRRIDEELAIKRRAQSQVKEEVIAQRQKKLATRQTTAATLPPVAQPVASARPALSKFDIQEKALEQAKLNKQRDDQYKIAKVEQLWAEARKLYKQGMYEEAIKSFQEIIKLEGNPRIKYTPYAQEYIQKAQQKLDLEKEQETTQKLDNRLDTIEKEMINQVKQRQIPPYVEPPERVEQAEEAPLVEPPIVRKKLKKKASLDFDKVDLKSAMLFLSQESGVNFIASQKVLDLGLKVSARFTDTPVDEIVKYVTKNLGLIYRIDKEIVWIAHPEEIAQEPLETRIYYLSRGGGLYTEFSPMSSGSDTGLGGSSAQINKVTTIEDTLKEVVPWPQDAKVTYDKRLNALVVRNTPQNLQLLEDIIYNLDITPYQILIEAKFLEVDVTDTKEFGLTWKFNADFPIQDSSAGSFSHGIAKDSGSSFTNAARVSEGLNLTYKGVLTTPQFQTVLHALEESKKIKTLSSPRITTLNNQMATIKVVDEWIYPTRYEYEIVQFDLNGDGDFNDAGETTFKNVPKDFMRRDVGILLKVIPSVGADKKTICLSLIPEVSEATADGFSYSGDVTLPKFTSRNLSTTVVVSSGDTVVLGGLIKESRTKTVTKVPFLGDIPVVGTFFRKNGDVIERKNLLIFVTAKLMSPSGEEITVANK